MNLVGRVESFATGGQVLITEETRTKIAAPLAIVGQFQVEPKGAARSLRLFEIGGLGEPFALSLSSRTIPLRPLATALPVQFAVLENKFVGTAVHDGHLTELFDYETHLSSSDTPAVLSNLKIAVAPGPQGNPAGEIYGKVAYARAGTPGLARIRFTSVTPELKAWISACGWGLGIVEMRDEAGPHELQAADLAVQSGRGFRYEALPLLQTVR